MLKNSQFNSMKKKLPLYKYSNEIDFIELLQIFWNGKVKIFLITIIFTLIGIGYTSQIPNSYELSITIQPSKNSNFVKFIPINQSLISSLINSSNQKYVTNQQLEINQELQINEITMLDRFVKEFLDFEEFIHVLQINSFVEENILQTEIERQRQILTYSKLLSLEKLDDNKDSGYLLKLIWANSEEGLKILSETLNLTKINLHKSVFKDLDYFLKIKKDIKISEDEQRILFLTEQSAIAKELDIAENQVDTVNLPQDKIAVNVTTNNIGYYLQGYKAIDKEISLIKSREHKENKKIKKRIELLKTEKINLVDYNLFLIDVKSLKNTRKYLFFSIFIGIIFGIIYVISSNLLRHRQFK